MPITQIPFQDPVAPPEKQPEQMGLYDARDWETAYSDVEAKVPHLLIQLQDDLARSRKREAVWISIIAHLLLFIVLWNANLIGKYMPWHRTVVALNTTKDKDVTFLALPPDLQKLTRKPHTNILGDKDRIATTRRPQLDPKELRKILQTPPPGAPGPSGRPTPQPAPPAQALAQAAPQQQQGQPPPPRPQFDTNQTAQLRMPPRDNSFSKYAAPLSAGSAIQQAEQGAAANHGGGGQGGDFGINMGPHGGAYGSLEILSDTLGVDFGPYLQRVHDEIERHWREVLPPSVFPPISKKGKLLIQFSIMKDGSVRGMALAVSSGDTALDRAAWGGIVGSSPLPPLPDEYIQRGGQDLTIRGMFIYNYDPKELQ
jgi:TonB family protein